MGNFLGAKHWVGFKPQTSAGTAESTVNRFMASESVSMNKNMTPIERKAHYASGVKLPPRLGWIQPDGKATTEVMASLPHPFYWALGGVVTTQPAVSTDPTVYLHAISNYDGSGNQYQPVLLTAEANRVFDYAKQGDVRISKWKLTAQPGEIGKLDIEWMGITHTDGATVTSTTSFPTDVLTCMASIVTIDGTTQVTVDQVEIEWDGGMDSVPVLEDASGSPHTIRRKDFPTVTGKLSFIDFPTAELTKLTSATPFALAIRLEGDTISNSYKKFLRVTLPACAYTGGLDPTIASEVVTGQAEFEAFYDTTTGKQISVAAQNTLTVINT